MRQLDTVEFRNEVENGTGLMLVDFSATWCGPCKMQTPILEELSDQADYKVFSIDVDKSQEIAAQYNVNAVPSLMIFKDGVLKENMIGFHTKDSIEEQMSKFL